MRTKKLKWGNPLFVLFLAVAGIFGVSSALVNKQVNDNQIVEKADATATNTHTRIYFKVTWDNVGGAWANSNWSYSLPRTNGLSPSYADLTYDTTGDKFLLDTTYVGANNVYLKFETDYSYWTCYPCWDGSQNWQYTGKLGYTFNVGTIYLLQTDSMYGKSDEFKVKWWNYSVDELGYFLNYDYKGGTAATGTKSHQEYLKSTASATLQAAPTKSGSTFLGWKRSDTGAIINAGESITDVSGPITLTAQWDTYVYYVTNSSSATGDYIYSWGVEEEFGSFPGKAITSVGSDVTGVVRFEGNGNKIYKIPITADTNFKFDNGTSSYQSANFTVVNGGAYWWGSLAANTDAGAALDLIFDLETARNNVTASGSIQNYSICGIDSSKRSSLVSRYNGLTDEGRRLVNVSTTYTYTGAGSTQGNVYFEAIFAQLSKMNGAKSNSAIGGLSLFNLFGETENDLSVIIIIAASSIALVSIGALSILIIKKRKTKEE